MKQFMAYLLLVLIALVLGYPYHATQMPYALLGLLIWGFIEYSFHRWIFHYNETPQNLLAYSHANHHEHPSDNEDLLLPLKLTVPVSILVFVLACVLIGVSGAAFLYTGLFIGCGVYEYIHHANHHGKSKRPILRWLRKYHLQHHFKEPSSHYGVTSPLFDYVFRTN